MMELPVFIFLYAIYYQVLTIRNVCFILFFTQLFLKTTSEIIPFILNTFLVWGMSHDGLHICAGDSICHLFS